MRLIAITLLGLALTGCASHPANVSSQQQPLVGLAYAPAPAAVLAFDAPVLAGTPRLDLSRDGRGASAFAGFEDSSTTYYCVTSNDGYSDYGAGGSGFGGGGDVNRDDYQRYAVSETTNVIRR